jgi:hypothetical protein
VCQLGSEQKLHVVFSSNTKLKDKYFPKQWRKCDEQTLVFVPLKFQTIGFRILRFMNASKIY